MSYNIDSVRLLSGSGQIRAADVLRLCKELNLPEVNLLDELKAAAKNAAPETLLPIRQWWWSGEFSGMSYNEGELRKLARCVVGSVDLLLTWEGGDSVLGIRISDGQLTECDVRMVLEPKR